MAAQADCRLQTRGAATSTSVCLCCPENNLQLVLLLFLPAEPVLTVTRPAVGTQPEALGTLAVVAADGVAADAVTAAARSCLIALIDVWESEEMKVKKKRRRVSLRRFQRSLSDL